MLYLFKVSDVCLEAEASPRGSKIAASASPQHFDALPRSRFMTSTLRYDINIHNFHPVIFCIYMLKISKTNLIYV